VNGPGRSSALLLLDLQNDFIHPEGAYARGGVDVLSFQRTVKTLRPLVGQIRGAGLPIISSHFTLVTGMNGAAFISAHLRRLRPFLKAGDFRSGTFGHCLVDELSPSDFAVEKVTYSAFYMSRLDWLLKQLSIDRLIVGGIVTNGAVASTVRDAHLRGLDVVLLSDGCAASNDESHDVNLKALSDVATIMRCDEIRLSE
jgi:ureidoacrylate peracid hydrolase